ncbi:helix-turn-helix transcriptional regulator [Bosea sp. (in: a-proteobacteria)]|uniref:helix-turn-helix transcriptional regulator n=1 Tax=Bosea sp. (in: a-proteobacteria) TaxID=1871050 RepID=UPI0027354675|nr:helix-turn-helix transcriptional regulator [Bosea sp. (in: a-proteobacteria)]MDP3255860.1 helix-turn-helix transcriptional regulator [Bosea sp. (in: a-proteobacteria)]
MSVSNIDAVIATVDSLLDGALDHARMPAAVERLRQLFEGSKACLASLGPGLSAADAVSTNSDEAMQRRCYTDLSEEFYRFGEVLRAVPVGTVYRDADLFGLEALRASRGWREWMEPQDMYGGIGCRLGDSGAHQRFFDVQRGRRQEPFGASDVALLQRLTPVLRRVSMLSREVGQLRLQRDEARGALDAVTLAIILVERDGRATYLNRGADDLLSAPCGLLALRQGRLVARQPGDQRDFKRLLDGAFAPGDAFGERRSSLILRSERGEVAPLSICVVPASPRRAEGPPPDRLLVALKPLGQGDEIAASSRQLFAFTDCESRIASALAGGLSLAQAAGLQGIRISTARTHLARIFQKTDTRQQSQLVALLQSAVLPLRGPR